MYSILVLGLIPGTHIQITFLVWLAAAAIVGLLVSIVWFAHKRRYSDLCIAAHYPKHANQLHQRGV